MSVLSFQADAGVLIVFADDRGFDGKSPGDSRGKITRIPRSLKPDYITADFVLQFGRSAQRNQLSLIQNRKTIATLGFFHQVSGQEDGDAGVVVDLPEVPARRVGLPVTLENR